MKEHDAFRLIVESVKDYAIFMLNPEGIITSWNQGAQLIKGYAASEIIGSHFSRFYTAVDIAREHPAEELEIAKRDGRFEEEGWRVRKDGSKFWASVVITRITDDQGLHVGFAKVTRDLTERRAAELARFEEQRKAAILEQTKDREQTLDQIFNQSPSFMTLLSVPDFRFLRTNAEHLKLIRKLNIIGKTVVEVEPELESQGILDLLNDVVRTGEPFVGREVAIHYAAVGPHPPRTAYLDFVYQPLKRADGKVYAIAAQGNDVTEKVLSRKMVENERANFRNLFRQTPEMVCILKGPQHIFEFVNEAHIRVLGFDATGMPVRQAQPESVEVHSILDEVYRTGKTAELREIVVTVGDRQRIFDLTYSARRNESGKINGIMILGTEVTHQVSLRESLLSHQRQLDASLRETQALLNASPSFFGFVDPQTHAITVVNDLALEVIGESKESIFGKVFYECPWWKPLPVSAARVRESLDKAATGTSSEFDLEYWSSLGGPAGQVRWVKFRAVPFVNGMGTVEKIAVSGVEITEVVHARKKLEETLSSRDDFFSVASHELKTPITNLKFQIQLFEREGKKAPKIYCRRQEWLEKWK